MKKIVFIFILLLIVIVCKAWFYHSTISAGDFPYYFSVSSQTILYPYAWLSIQNLGGYNIPYIVNLFPISPIVFFLFTLFHLSWDVIGRVVYFYPTIVLAFLSSYFLYKRIGFDRRFIFLAVGILLFNTYMLMVLGGGQILLAMALSIAPAVLGLLFTLSPNFSFQKILILGVLYAVEVGLDLRIAYMLFLSIIIFILMKTILERDLKYARQSFLTLLILPLIITGILHMFWIFPTLVMRENPLQQLGAIYSTTGAVRFFSFGKFEYAFGLLHPNWPENIFGKVGFMKPEFLLLPLLAYGSLLFLKKTQKKETLYILFFALLGLIGIFLAKGANDPFGDVYLWFFQHVPGFVMFRDPTKWYFFIVLSYTMLIPFTVSKVYGLIQKHYAKWYVAQIFVGVIVAYLLFLIWPALSRQLTGTFQPHTIPTEYKTLEKLLLSQNNFSRTLWIPTIQRFGYYSNTHPAISAQDFFSVTSVSEVLDILQKKGTENMLQEAGVKYVIIPYDSEREIFIKDRKYNNELYFSTIQKVSSIPWLTSLSGFGNIAIFELPNPKNHFWLQGQSEVSYTFLNQTKYLVNVKNVEKGERLIFSERYNNGWKMSTDTTVIDSEQYHTIYNSFFLPRSGTYTLTVFFSPQKWVDIGVRISAIASSIVLIGLIGIIWYRLKRI